MCLMPEEELAKCKLSPYKEIALQYAKEKKQRDVEFLTFPITGIDFPNNRYRLLAYSTSTTEIKVFSSTLNYNFPQMGMLQRTLLYWNLFQDLLLK